MHYHIDKTAAQSAYLQLYHQLRRDIVSGVYPLGTKMPSKRLIATETGVSVITVEHALAILCDEGYLESRERSGFFVSFAAADCFPVSETETERRTTVSHGTEDEFPFPSLAKTMRRVLSEYGESILVKSPNNGCAELRGTIAAYLSRSRGISVQPGQIVIGSGAEYLYGLIVQLLGRERVFALEDPSYDKIRRVYQAHGVTCEMLRLGSDGIRSDELTRASATVLHVTPFHSFPSQVTASAGKRREYLRWAEERRRLHRRGRLRFGIQRVEQERGYALRPRARALGHLHEYVFQDHRAVDARGLHGAAARALRAVSARGGILFLHRAGL